MATITRFEELEIWILSRQFVNLIYSDFRSCRDFSFKDQICGAGISIMNNISEGFCRNSDAEFRQFLNISKGSAGETRSQLYRALDNAYISEEEFQKAYNLAEDISKLIAGLINHLKTSNIKGDKFK